MRRLVIGLALLGLAGCGRVGGGEWSYARLRSACRTEGGARWLGPPPASLEGLLLVNGVQDPSRTGGRLWPDRPHGYSGAHYDWMRRTGLKTIFLYLKPDVDPAEQPWMTAGPFKGEPEGVYQFDLLPASHPRCRPILERYERYRQSEFARGAPATTYPDLTECTAYEYRGPLDVSAYPFVYVYWHDESLKGSGASRWVHEIRRGSGETIGRAVFYSGQDPLQWAPECFHKSTNFRGWFPNSPVDAVR